MHKMVDSEHNNNSFHMSYVIAQTRPIASIRYYISLRATPAQSYDESHSYLYMIEPLLFIYKKLRIYPSGECVSLWVVQIISLWAS